MLSKEQYDVILGYKPMIDMYVSTQTYVGGADGLFDYLEAQGLTGGEKILRGCPPCLAGFLKFTKSLLNEYEKINS